MRVDLNADVGEGATPQEVASELSLIPFVTSVNISCGAHAGDPQTMRQALERARDAGVSCGAHPGYPDREGRGRREQEWLPPLASQLVAQQVRSLAEVARSLGLALSHVKPHGAMYNQAARDRRLADAIAAGVAAVDPGLRLIGLAGSALLTAGMAAGLSVVAEAFADRAYRCDGSLVPRTEPGAVLSAADAAVAQAVGIVCDQRVRASDGSWLQVRADTICLHGDTPGAARFARQIRDALRAAGVEVRAPQ